MIQDATGKFSSRWVLPDRNSLARFIRTWLLSLYQAWSVSSAAAQSLRVFAQAAQAYTPYRGTRFGGNSKNITVFPILRTIAPRQTGRERGEHGWNRFED